MILSRLSAKALFSIYILLSALTLAGLGGFILKYKSRQTVQHLQAQTLQVELQTAAKYLQLFIEDKKNNLERISQLPFSINLAMGNVLLRSDIKDHLNNANALQQGEVISYYDIAGDLIYQSSDIPQHEPELIEQVLFEEQDCHVLLHQHAEQLMVEMILPIVYQEGVEGAIVLYLPFDLEDFFSGIFSEEMRWVGFKQELTELDMQPPADQHWQMLTTKLNPESIELYYAVNQIEQETQQQQLLISLMQSLLIAVTLAFIVIYLLGDKLLISPFQQLTLSKAKLLRQTKKLEHSYAKIEQSIEEQKQLQIEANQARVQAERASAAKTQFLANISHEIRTPMNGVLGITQLMLKTEINDEQKNYLETLFDSGNHMMSVLNDVLDFAKIEAGKLDIVTEATQLKSIDELIKYNLSSMCKAKDLNFEYQNNAALDKYYDIDKSRVNQVLLNLISNAVKFTEEGLVKVIITSLEQDGKHFFSIDVEDSGIGIDPSRQEHIFKDFAQAEETTTRKFGGTGLGLSIVKHLVELMEGEIAVSSELGFGTRFTVTILAPVVEPAQNQEKQEKKEIFKGSGQHVLIAEDNKVNAFVLTTMLKKRGITAATAVNGKLAVELLASGESFDLIVMDNNMPEMDGVCATQAIKQLDNGAQNIPIVGYTADAHTETKETMVNAGCEMVLLKPLHENNLDAMLRQIFS